MKTVRAHWSESSFLKKWTNASLFFIYFCLFKQTFQYVKNVPLEYGAGIWTHDLQYMNLLR